MPRDPVLDVFLGNSLVPSGEKIKMWMEIGICVSSLSYFYTPVAFFSCSSLKGAYVSCVLAIPLYAAHSLLAQTLSVAHMVTDDQQQANCSPGVVKAWLVINWSGRQPNSSRSIEN